ncbi:hypothetical protein E4U21_004243 [Claviceps maximensis]|nr:hypothetical protein E4U21_004243 [Claviceps maximensis]
MATSFINKNISSTMTTNRNSHNVDDWEEWEDDEVVTPVEANEQVGVGSSQPPASSPHGDNTKTTSTRASRISTVKIRRLRSRQRQKAQNAKAGIRLITDMSTFRRSYYGADNARGSPRARAGKFVDAAALRALEGEPSSASVGNWNWLKKRNGKSPVSATADRGYRFQGDQSNQVSPEDGPIVIGISLASSNLPRDQDMSLETAPVRNHPQIPSMDRTGNVSNSHAQKSVWSPDTPDTSFSFGSGRAVLRTILQAPMPGSFLKEQTPPSAPALPADYVKQTPPHKKVLSLELGKSSEEEPEDSSPYTLFEEDGVPSPQRRIKANGLGLSPDRACSRSQGWWDHVVTPFLDKKMSFSGRNYQVDTSPKDGERKEYWTCQAVKSSPAVAATASPPSSSTSGTIVPTASQAPLARAPTPRGYSSTCSDAAQHERCRIPLAEAILVPVAGSRAAATPRVAVNRGCSSNTPECPPPYSPSERQRDGKPIRYRAVFPPGHALHSHFPPTPRLESPGLAAAMTSQGGAASEIDHSPALLRTQPPQTVVSVPLPVRPTGTFVPAEHMYATAGKRHRVERRRRRHEKEEVIARRAGGFWRGRGCISSKGCFGRSGREGRQRRRVWIAVWGGIVALVVLIILLAVLLTRHHQHGMSAETPSIWVNLTDYPPMPTGVLTVVGPDNTAAKSGCTEPSTLWSCSLPKDQHTSVLPYRPDQPTVMMQIEWDNGTARAWNIPNGDAPPAAASVARRAHGAASFARALLQRRQAQSQTVETPLFAPNPAPPSFREMWFLGETTDDIRSDQKAGEPTPFYISLVPPSGNPLSMPAAAATRLSRRESSSTIGNETFKNLIPPPDVEADGTSGPAVLMPHPVQQPVRLFDRGLPTEHYGFYTYFKKTIFLKSISVQDHAKNNDDNSKGDDDGHGRNTTADAVSLDKDGGCRKTEASHLVTWGETRLRIQIWTRLGEASLLKTDGGGAGSSSSSSSTRLVRPGTMPYPVTVTQDTHGGDPDRKLVWERAIDERLRVQQDQAQALINDMGIGGTWVNRRGMGDERFGGFDGGTGGCKCEWVNWV